MDEAGSGTGAAGESVNAGDTAAVKLWWERVLEYEAGTMYLSDATAWFQELVDTGNIWRLPGKYLEQAAYFIRKDVIKIKGKDNALQSM